MFGDLDRPINVSHRFVSNSWVSCFYYHTLLTPPIISTNLWNF